MSDLQAWLALLGLGAFHGINPGMGWLFAVALGLQEQRRSAVLRALLPIALGHALSIGAVVLVLGLLQDQLPDAWLRWPVGVGLALFGLFKLFRSRHPRWVGMRVNFFDLTAWSFLMATAMVPPPQPKAALQMPVTVITTAPPTPASNTSHQP